MGKTTVSILLFLYYIVGLTIFPAHADSLRIPGLHGVNLRVYTLSLSWDNPTVYTDDTPISEGTGSDVPAYARAYWGEGASTCPTGTSAVIVWPVNKISMRDILNQAALSSVATGTYEFAITVTTVGGIESDCSATVDKYLGR